uniref:Putative inositol phosphorylceramide glucuronosyltransferase 1 n=1 Tax=Davidia involucrata TaxID=16924 RepID=A0A5B7B0J2_DAVIN
MLDTYTTVSDPGVRLCILLFLHPLLIPIHSSQMVRSPRCLLCWAIVPRQVMPWTGLLLIYEWTFTIFFLLFGSYLHFIYQWGKMTANQAGSFSRPEAFDYDSGRGHQRRVSSCDVATWYYGLGMAFLAVAAPSLPCVFGITALFMRLGLIVVGGVVLASFMTYAAEHIAIRSFLRGLEDWGRPRTRSICFFC